MIINKLTQVKKLEEDWRILQSEIMQLISFEDPADYDEEGNLHLLILDQVSSAIHQERKALQVKYDQTIRSIKEHGYEIRLIECCGHICDFAAITPETDLNLLNYIAKDNANQFKYIICPQALPKVKKIIVDTISDWECGLTGVQENPTTIHILCERNAYFDKDWILSHGECEQTAWDIAVANWPAYEQSLKQLKSIQ